MEPERTALVLPLDRAERLFGDLRRANVHELTAYVPAHVTLAHPLPAMAEFGERLERLRAVFAAEAPFELTLEGFGRFEAARVLYLLAHPSDRLQRLADACFAACPGAEPEHPQHIFHVTLVQGGDNLDAAQGAVAKRFAADLPLIERIDRAEIYAKFGGGWRLKEVLPFSAAPP
ncbi:2'-5' RNA ligase family protein [Phenylobacterium sp.]|uniref:2'-5' RNA ligase family protein n=1 Tax=Phenylobacterium sp. TaxID=1871053 RepID=UPI002F94CAE0